MKRRIKHAICLVIGGIGLAAGPMGCASHAGNGALLGGATGAGIGAIIGHNSHDRTAEGALIGGAVGALVGGAIGDAQDREERSRYADERHYPNYRHRHYHRYDDCPPDYYYEYRSVRREPYHGYSEYRVYRSY